MTSSWLKVLFAIWIGLIIFYGVVVYPCRYPTVHDMNMFLYMTGCNIVLPLVFIIMSAFFAHYALGKWCRRTRVIAIVLLIFAFMNTMTESFAPTVISATTDPRHFGKYDKDIPADEFRYFPQEIPEEAEDVQYYYWYMCHESSYWYIAVSWKCKNWKEIQNSIADISREDGRGYIKVFVDEESGRVCYVIAGNRDYLPSRMADAFEEI